jgi:hypothetical protein
MALIDFQTAAGDPITADDIQIVPIARSVRILVPGLHGGLIWNRPVAVVFRTADGRELELPVHDVTRRWQILLLGMGLIGALLIWVVLRREAPS